MSNDDTKERGCGVLPPSAPDGYLRNPRKDLHQNSNLETRLARIESRLVQLMLHFGLDPQRKYYD
jgi:hypothetical protein